MNLQKRKQVPGCKIQITKKAPLVRRAIYNLPQKEIITVPDTYADNSSVVFSHEDSCYSKSSALSSKETLVPMN